MMAAYDEGLAHLSSDYIWLVGPGENIVIREVKKGGEGEARFTASCDTIVIKAQDQSPIVWALKNRKCGEAAMISVAQEGVHLHVLEMKSRLTQGQLAKAIEQLEGIYLSALAISRLIGIDEIKNVTCYIGYKENALSPKRSADMIMFKTFVGKENPISGVDEWEVRKINLPFGVVSNVKAVQRDAQGHAAFGTV